MVRPKAGKKTEQKLLDERRGSFAAIVAIVASPSSLVPFRLAYRATSAARRILKSLSLALLILIGLGAFASQAHAQDRVLTISFVPTHRAQIAVWIESADGTFLATLGLTESVAYRGVGNRPGALQMNSGFRWPYGRRESVLPVWAHARLRAAGAQPFPRVIFQDRVEGYASRTTADQSRDDFFCLSFDSSTTTQDALDAVSCASIFNSDKGRYLTPADVDAGYSEPWEEVGGLDIDRALSLTSLYPPRRDVVRCTLAGCNDHSDVDRFRDDARAIMPEIDAITMATPAGDTPQSLLYSVPNDWPDAEYVLFVEVHTEGDHNATYGPTTYPTPTGSGWDIWAETYGYPYRGQPSVVYRLPFTLTSGTSVSTATAVGYGSLHGEDGDIRPLDASIEDAPTTNPGSGVDRLRLDASSRRLRLLLPACSDMQPAPNAVTELSAGPHPDEKNSHRWASLRFRVPAFGRTLGRYDVRVSTEPFAQEIDFERGLPAKEPDPADPDDVVAMQLPVDRSTGELIEATLAGLTRETKHYIAVRAVSVCNEAGPYSVAEVTTTAIHYTTVSPCFVATAAYGTPMANEIQSLRHFRDEYLMTHPAGRAFVALYYEYGPLAADFIRGDDELRALTRSALRPLVALARWLD